MATKKRRIKLARVRAAAETGVPDRDEVLANLREIYAKLDRVDASSIGDDEYLKWRNEYSATRKAIMVLETADFDDLDRNHREMAAEIAGAIQECERALHGIQDGARVIKVAGAIAGSLAKLVALFA